MKEITSIFLIGLLAFNWFGYRLAIGYFQNQADIRLESRVDANEYEESQLLEIKLAMNIPYQNDRSAFERCYGEIEIDGMSYNYVKRKVQDGFLILKCIPNTAKHNLKEADIRIFKAHNGLDAYSFSGKESSSFNSIHKQVINTYYNYIANYRLEPLTGSANSTIPRSGLSVKNTCLPVAEQPPDTV